MWQVSVYFAGVWYGVGPEYPTEMDAELAVRNWMVMRGMNPERRSDSFRIDKLPDRSLSLTVEEILAREG